MQHFENLPVLDKKALFSLLSRRFRDREKKLSHIPNPDLLKDAVKAAKKIASAIKEKKKIALIGDYDVDGVSSTAIVIEFFREIPYPIEPIIPNRFFDGYGISPTILQRVDADLIITVDNGINALQAAQICKERGIDLIITDHHTPSDTLPEAYAIVNPKLFTCSYPFKDICGAQVAWLLLGALKKELTLQINMKRFLDILAIAIIADIMPLQDINRSIVKEGLKILSSSQRPSSIIIRDFLNKSTITSEDIGFQIAPRINSAGRLEDAATALAFLTAQNTREAYLQFEKLDTLNERRREQEAQTTKEALDLVDENRKENILVIAKEEWHEGLVGIVASRLVDHFSKPAIVLSIQNGRAKGSARSIGKVNIYELLEKNQRFLRKFGGHKMAAGIEIDENKLSAFKEALNRSASKVDPSHFLPSDDVVGILPSAEIDFELLNLLETFEPYGESNKRPSFFIQNAHIIAINYFGKEKSHSKIRLRQFTHESKTLELILFKQALQMPADKKITCSYRVVKNEFNAQISAQLIIDKIYS